MVFIVKTSKMIMTDRYMGRVPKNKTLKMYFTRKAKIQIQKALGFGELYLLEYWLECTGSPLGYIVDDKETALALGLTLRSVKKYRLSLQQANLFRTIKTSNKDVKFYIYCFGKEGVYTACYFPDIFGYGINSIAGAIKKYGIDEIRNILDGSPLKPIERKEIYALFDSKYKGQFVMDEAA